jgi:hypothetical protein
MRQSETHGEVEGGEVVVEEELTRHEVEWKVVEEPSKRKEPTELIVEDDGS